MSKLDDLHRFENDPDLNLALQTLWDARGVLGFDNDGDPTPGALIAGMGIEWFCRNVLSDAREHMEDYNEMLDDYNEMLDEASTVDELETRIDFLEEQLDRARLQLDGYESTGRFQETLKRLQVERNQP